MRAFTLTQLELLASLSFASPLSRPEARRSDGTLPVPYSLPDPRHDNAESREADIANTRSVWTYGEGIGGGSFSPAGPLGMAAIERDALIYRQEGGAQLSVVRADNASAIASIEKYNGLKTLDDYVKLYDDEWVNSSSPTGVCPGILSNYTQDVLFSMERLSFNPYAVRRLNIQEDLPFSMEDALARSVAGQSLSELQAAERLFYVDHRDQHNLTQGTDGKYAAACDAYFYISNSSGDFLPLAIRTNTNNSLVYSPRDAPEDWLLAKIIFNVNDFFMAQFHHLANTHFVAEIAYQAAIRTLSDQHPLLAILDRIMYGTFGIRPSAVASLFGPGAAVDRFFVFTGSAAVQYSSRIYESGYAGAFRANYLDQNLKRRGLLDSTGPALKHFPFYEDALPIYQTTRKFITSFVESYYDDDKAISDDRELQAWLTEASGPARAIDFPTGEDLKTTSDLVDVLAHIAHLSSSAHHAINTNQLITSAGVLPFHPTALYKSIPTAKGVTDVASYLPPLQKSLGFLTVQANFARPLLASTNRSLVHMFDDEKMLGRMNQATRDANAEFMVAMKSRSDVIKSRAFDQNGLSQGMPFLWKALDPETIPWSLSI